MGNIQGNLHHCLKKKLANCDGNEFNYLLILFFLKLIVFHFILYFTERLLVYSCVHNYRTDHCMYLSTCPPAEKTGVVVVHGSRGSFHGEKQPAFCAIYRAMEEVSYFFFFL